MNLVVFGLSITSSWGNGHATLWRGLCRALRKRGHCVTFFERDAPYYAAHRDFPSSQDVEIVLYTSWQELKPRAVQAVSSAGVAMVTSYCPDALAATDLVAGSRGLKVFYDLDTPVTLAQLDAGKDVPYLGPAGLKDFDLVLSFTGGTALNRLRTQLGARRVAPLYGSVDPEVHFPTAPIPEYAADLSYLGTYAADRQERFQSLFLDVAQREPSKRFVLGGSQYPSLPDLENLRYYEHVPPGRHSAFYCSSGMTLNITRGAMAALGYCPSGRLFEAAACGAAILSDFWCGLDEFFAPGKEILIAESTENAQEMISMPERELQQIGAAARRGVLTRHTADCRASDLEAILAGL